MGYGNLAMSSSSIISRKSAPVMELRKYLETHMRGEVDRFVHINEYRTSKMCHACAKETKQLDKEDYKEKSTFPFVPKSPLHTSVYSVLRCNNGCGIIVDRDVNAAKNILHLLERQLDGSERPAFLTRQLVLRNA